jgi:hypothetical protein
MGFQKSQPVEAGHCIVQVLVNHVSRGTRIDRKIAARDVLNRRAELAVSSGFYAPNNFFIGAHGQGLSVPRVQPSRGCPERWAVTKAS